MVMRGFPPLPPGMKEALERAATALWFAGVCLLLYLTLLAQAARGDDLDDVRAGTLLFESAAGGLDAVPPLATDVRISIAGVVARVAVTQRFRNPSELWAEAVYAFPLPDDAAVDRLRMTIGERVIEGEIHERAEAEQIYGAARAAGQRASLVRQTTPNLFTTAVANIAPHETIAVSIEYLQTARFDGGELSLRFPMTITPRYGAGDTPEQAEPLAARNASLDGPPPADASAVAGAPLHSEATIHVDLAPGFALGAVEARSHAISVLRQSAASDGAARATGYGGGDGFDTSSGAGGGNLAPSRNVAAADHYVIETFAPRVPMDRDFVLAWQPQADTQPIVAALTETKGDSTYALLMIVPPPTVHAQPVQPREMIYVIDTSGSMGGQSIAQAKLALEDALGRLTSVDRFNIFQFNSWTSSLYRAPVALTAESYAEALRYVQGLESTGGTEMEPAIRAALAQPATAGYLRQVIFLTDGAVAGETALFGAIKSSLGSARLFTIGIGSAPNSHFMRKAAQFGRGTYTHIAKESEIASAMGKLLGKIERVALTDVLVDWPEAHEIYPNELPDLYSGEPIVVTARFPAHGGAPLALEAFGRITGAQWSQRVSAPPESLPGIAALWARRKIEYLTDSRVDGADEALIRKLTLDVALEHGLVSPYTSLVAVDRTPARSEAAKLERQALGNMTPHGAQWTTLPQTATPAPLYRWLGALALLVAAAVGVSGTRRGRLA
jgi:Ca-activated chloride channel family protein